MTLEMQYIYQVYLERNISRAAEKLYISQPALSVTIKKAEERLGTLLFDRDQRPLALTAAGEAYIRMVRQTMWLEQELEQEISDIQNIRKGTLCIGGSHYINAHILPNILTGFTREYPGIQLSLVEKSSAELAEMLSQRQVDLTFNCDPAFLEGFEHTPAFHDTILLAVHEDNPIHACMWSSSLSARQILDKVHLRDDCPVVPLTVFRDLDFLLLQEGNNLYRRSVHLFEEAGFEPKIKASLSQLVTAYHMANAGFAATFISDRLIETEETQLRFFKLKSDQIRRHFCIVLPGKSYTSHAVRAFIEFFRLHKEEL